MLFSDFIKDSLLGKNNIAWNYYHHANINTDNILHADTSAEFIRKYFENGEKELPLLLNPECAAAFLKDYFLAARKEQVLFFEFDRQYALPPERAIHTVSGFFLGLLIENCLNAENSLSIENPGYFPFSYFWFATVYKGNIIKNLIMDCQSYTKYRPNETTGGIFVSWRRKEELPTGA